MIGKPGSRARHLRPMLSIASAICISLLSSTSVLAADEQQPTSQLTEKWVKKVYQPAFQNFANAANQWASSSENLCDSTRGSRIYGLQTTFTELVADFARVEVFRSGPMQENNLRNRLFYWPDSRRVGERQLRALLADSETADLNRQQLAEKSVAVQGFPALERLLFNTKDRAVESAPQCHVIVTIIQNIASMASQLEHGWQTESDYTQAFLHPQPSSSIFRSNEEVLRTVLTEVIVGLDVLIDRKLQPLLSGDPGTIRTAPFWRSQRTVAMLKGNLSSIQSLLFDSGLLQKMAMEDELAVDFAYANHLLERLKYKFSFADDSGQLNGEVRWIFAGLSAALDGIRHVVKLQVARPLGIGVAFNAEDGD